MKKDYSKIAATANRLIQKFGVDVIWRSVIKQGEIDQPWKEINVPTYDSPVSIAYFPVDKSNMETFAYIPETDIPKGALVGYMGSQVFTPSTQDIVIRDGELLRIHAIVEIKPASSVILYSIIFKR